MKMPLLPSGSIRTQTMIAIGVAAIVFLGIYLGAAFYSISGVYAAAVKESEQHAHTIIGKEGYEYIFEPSTQILVDRIKPNGRKIISYLVLRDYLLFKDRSNCAYSDPFVCNWIIIQMNPGLHQPIQPWRLILIALIPGLVTAGGYFLLTRW